MAKQELGDTSIDLEEGISVIIPTYKGEKWILKCLESLAKQTFSKTLFEIIIVINGEKDSTETLIQNFHNLHPNLNLIILSIKQPGVSNARNKGIEKASKNHITFIDDDDFVSETYLEALYKYAEPGTLVIGEMVDITDEVKNSDTFINREIHKARNKEHITYEDLLPALRINTLKLLPTALIKQILYDTTLNNGEDVVYFTELLVKFDLNLKLADEGKAVYFRLLRNNSVSRKEQSFQFNITERLKVIEKLNKLFYITTNTKKYHLIKNAINAQMGFINTYILENPDSRQSVLEEEQKYDLIYFPYKEWQLKNRVKKLQKQYEECQASDVYKAGTLLVHETSSLSDILHLTFKFYQLKKEKTGKTDTMNKKKFTQQLKAKLPVQKIKKVIKRLPYIQKILPQTQVHSPKNKPKKLNTVNHILQLTKNGYEYTDAHYEHTGNKSPMTIVYAIHNSLPETNNGYAIRSHYIAQSVKKQNITIYPITRVGFPIDLKNIGSYANDDFNPIVNGLPYYRLYKQGYEWGKTTISEYIANYAKMLAHFSHARNATLIHAASNYINGLAGVNAAKILNIPSIYEVRGFWEITTASRNPEFKNSDLFNMQRTLETQACKDATSVIALSEIVKEELIHRGIEEEKIHVLPNGVDTEKMKPLEKNTTLLEELEWKEKFIVGFIGSIVDYEGLGFLIEAAEKLQNKGYSNIRYLIVGDGNDLENLKKSVNDKNLSHLFKFTGRVPYEDVERYYSIMDCTCYPRLNWEVCSIVSPKKPFEAMAYGIPIISSSVRANSYFIENGVNGLIHESEDSDSLMKNIQLLHDNTTLKKEIGQNGREWVVQNRESRITGPALEKVYQEAIKQFSMKNQ